MAGRKLEMCFYLFFEDLFLTHGRGSEDQKGIIRQTEIMEIED